MPGWWRLLGFGGSVLLAASAFAPFAVSIPLWCAGLTAIGFAWWKGALSTVLTGALVAMPLLLAPPLGSSDVYSYACQGWLWINGSDPYTTGVLDGGCPWAAEVPEIWWHTPAPYGPLAIAISGAAAATGNLTAALAILRLAALTGAALLICHLPTLTRAHLTLRNLTLPSLTRPHLDPHPVRRDQQPSGSRPKGSGSPQPDHGQRSDPRNGPNDGVDQPGGGDSGGGQTSRDGHANGEGHASGDGQASGDGRGSGGGQTSRDGQASGERHASGDGQASDGDGGDDHSGLAWVLALGVISPLVLVHGLSGAHNDLLMAGLMVASLAVAADRPSNPDMPDIRQSTRWVKAAFAGALIAAAIAIKVTAIVALPFILILLTRHQMRLPTQPEAASEPGPGNRRPTNVAEVAGEPDVGNLRRASGADVAGGPEVDTFQQPPEGPDVAGEPDVASLGRASGTEVAGEPDVASLGRASGTEVAGEPDVASLGRASGTEVAGEEKAGSSGWAGGVAGLVGIVGTFLGVTAATGLGFGWVTALGGTGGVTQWSSPPTAVGMAVSYVLRLFGVDSGVPVTVARALALVALAVIGLILVKQAWQGTRDVIVACGLALAAATLLGPVFYPWYAIAPIAVLATADLTASREGRSGPPRASDLKILILICTALALPNGDGIPALTKLPGALIVTGILIWLVFRKLSPGRAA